MIPLGFEQFKSKRTMIIRAEHDADLIKFIREVAEENGIEAGTFTVIGTLKEAKLEFYNQERCEYQEMTIQKPCEIASCVGNISLKGGDPFVHAHAVLADRDGRTRGGHLSEARVFAAEIHLQVLEGPKLERKHDEVTDLSLWELGE